MKSPRRVHDGMDMILFMLELMVFERAGYLLLSKSTIHSLVYSFLLTVIASIIDGVRFERVR